MTDKVKQTGSRYSAKTRSLAQETREIVKSLNSASCPEFAVFLEHIKHISDSIADEEPDSDDE